MEVRVLIKVLHIAYCFDGGVGKVLTEYYKFIDQNKVSMDFFIACSEKKSEIIRDLEQTGAKIFYKMYSETSSDRKCKLKNILKENKYNIVHMHGFFFLSDIIIVRKKGIRNIILHSHNPVLKEGKLSKNRLIQHVKNSVIYSAVSDYWACSSDAGKTMFGYRKFKVLPNAIQIDNYLFDDQIRHKYREMLDVRDKYVLIAVGRVTRQKNYDFLLEVFKRVLEIDNRIELLIIGNGDLLEVTKTKVNKMGLSENVRFLGGRGDVPELLMSADMFVLPSLFEGFGIVALEAQASGLPCLISNGFPEEVMVSDLTKRISTNSENIDQWVDEILAKKQKNTEERIMYNNVLKKTEFNIQTASNLMVTLYSEIVERRKK